MLAIAAERIAAEVPGGAPLGMARPLELSGFGGAGRCGGGDGMAAAKRTAVALVPANVAGTLCAHGAWNCSEAIMDATIPA